MSFGSNNPIGWLFPFRVNAKVKVSVRTRLKASSKGRVWAYLISRDMLVRPRDTAHHLPSCIESDKVNSAFW